MATQQRSRRNTATTKSSQSTSNRSSGPSTTEVASRAAEQLRGLTSRDVESVTGVERADEGWTIRLEVVESRRIPDSADILALYEVQVDSQAELTGYRRIRRYGRGQTGDD